MTTGDVIIATLPGAAETKVRPAVVIASEIYLMERPDILVGILTRSMPAQLNQSHYVLADWRAAGLRSQSCFRTYVITQHRSNATVIGHLSQRDWAAVRLRVRASFAN